MARPNPFETIRKQAGGEKKSVTWYQTQVKKLGNINTNQLLRQGNLTNRIMPGFMYLFGYDPKTKEKQYTSRDFDVFASKRTDYTAGELKNIEVAAKAGASRAKQEAAKAETAKKRLTRGTGGLAAKAIPVGGSGGTGLPELGTGGLQLGATSLGKGLFI